MAFGTGLSPFSTQGVQQALNIRGAGGSVPLLDQTSQDSMTPPGMPPIVGGGNSLGSKLSMPMTSPPAAGMPPVAREKNETQMIIQTLAKRLDTLSNIEKTNSAPPMPPAIPPFMA